MSPLPPIIIATIVTNYNARNQHHKFLRHRWHLSPLQSLSQIIARTIFIANVRAPVATNRHARHARAQTITRIIIIITNHRVAIAIRRIGDDSAINHQSGAIQVRVGPGRHRALRSTIRGPCIFASDPARPSEAHFRLAARSACPCGRAVPPQESCRALDPFRPVSTRFDRAFAPFDRAFDRAFDPFRPRACPVVTTRSTTRSTRFDRAFDRAFDHAFDPFRPRACRPPAGELRALVASAHYIFIL